MRPIDADKIPYVEALTDTFELSGKFYARREDIDAMPTIDSVPVVRCKDCKHLFDGEHNVNCCELLMRKAKWLTEITVDMNWYCADGERRTDERPN